ncbi:ABC-ATPase domain-containing protein [Desulfallas sp. Bu1-1]|uniref:ABC-ATPase domain-containing protein n=1 Tax=Desulfallas sp. Bu1-1 TaxID=2787620 RepID=UPI00189D17BA|nr:ABC-ATPase domain-containing protein [Desulfallas sp. Bu1-1]MBF7082342.1 ABC-ATPase domain-containing protein [Desulfallas sp. Bu1-1]
MQSSQDLRQKITSIDHKGYGAYKSLAGAYKYDFFTLFVDHVQSDPFAPPSRVRARVPRDIAGFPGKYYATRPARVALQDFLTRRFGALARTCSERKGTGSSGVIAIDRCGQEVLERTSMVVNDEYVEARFVIGLPARGRTVMAREAVEIFMEHVPEIVKKTLIFRNLDREKLREHVELAEDQEALRKKLSEMGLVAFVADGSVLPRESGVSDLPLKGKNVIPFQSPPEYSVSISLPHRGEVTGMGIPRGVTLIVGGGYHGKSTLLRAIERGVYNHLPGDGRELVITVADAVKIRAEDGRSVAGVDISGFINNLPFGRDTRNFSTANASGSTSQAANIVEALETGTSLLLLDEDTSATNFMIRDGRMQQLVAKEMEPITPFIDTVRDLLDNFNISTILVVGGSGDYFEVADRVIMMQNYLPRDVTARAREIAAATRGGRRRETACPLTTVRERIPLPEAFRLQGDKVKARGLNDIQLGRDNIDLQNVEQLVDNSQTAALAAIIKYAALRYIDGKTTLMQVIQAVLHDIEKGGLEVVSPFKGQHPGDMALPRKYEIAAAFNRYRGLKVAQK